MSKTWVGRTLVVSLAAALSTVTGFGQESWGRILGTVTDQSGAVVPAAKVVATSPTLPKGLETVSDGLGNYLLPQVPIGTYSVEISKTGFQTVRQTNLEVRLGAQVMYNARLPVGQVAEVVEVTSSSVQLETTSSRTSTNITPNDFQNLAKGRSFHSILVLAPGVRQEPKAGSAGVGGIQVDGASGSENTYYIDGVEVSDLMSGALRQQNAIPFEMVSEVQVKSGGFEAEYGGATGGVINVATRAGANAFHGEVNFQFTNSRLNAGDRAYWKLLPTNVNIADYFRPKEDDYSIWFPGGSLGGPIVKDRLFFYGSYMPELESTDRIVSYPAGPRTFTQDRKRHYGLGRLDFSPSSKWQINSSYIWSPFKVLGQLVDRDARVPSPANDLSVEGHYIPAETYTATASFSATPSLLFSARYGYKYLNNKAFNYGKAGAPYLYYETASAQATGVPGNVAGPSAFRNVSSTFLTLRDVTTRHNVYVDGSYLKNIAGQQHIFKAGWAINRVGNDVEDDYTNGYFRIFWGEAFSRGSVTNARGTYGYYIWEDGVRHKSKVAGRNQGFYVQDTWRAHSRLTLNLGVRFENEFLPPYKAEVGSIKVANPVAFGWGEKIAPRIGAAWDILGNGTWKLSGSFGLFYDVMKYELARGSFGGDYWFSHVYRLDNPNVLGLGKATPGAAGARVISYDNRTIPINERGELDGIDPDIKPYASREYSVTLEHALASRLTAAVRYSRKDLLKTLEDIGVLDTEDNEVYLIGNPGFGQTRNTKSVYGQKTPNGKEFLVPKAVRQYDGLEFSLRGQVAKVNLFGSYTYSCLYGNYGGLANSDESGRSDPGVSRAFDLPYYYFDASGSQENVFGRLGTDRPHALKLFGSYDVKSKAGTSTIGLSQLALSGSLDSTSVIYLSAPTYPFGRGDMGRTDPYTQTDLFFAHTVKTGERGSIKFEANFQNLFNEASVLSRVSQINRASAITDARLPLSRFFAGYQVSDFVRPGSTTPPYNAIYGLPSGSYRRAGEGPLLGDVQLPSAFRVGVPNYGAYQGFRVIRLGLRFIF